MPEEKMKKRLISLEFKIGLFILVALCVLIFFIFSQGRFSGKSYQLQVMFNYISGLDAGSPVRVSGLRVGEVSDLGLAYKFENGMEKPKIAVTIKLRPDIRLGRHSLFTVGSSGLIGEKYLEIVPTGLNDNPLIHSGETITGTDPVQFEQMLSKGEGILNNLDTITVSLNKLVGNRKFQENLGELGSNLNDFIKKTSASLDNFNRLAGSFAKMSDDVHGMLGENKQNINTFITDSDRMVKNISRLTEDTSGRLGSITNSVEAASGSVQGFFTNLQTKGLIADIETDTEILKDAKSAIKELQNASATFSQDAVKFGVLSDRLTETLTYVNEGKGTVGKLIYDDQLYRTVLDMVNDLKEHPAKLFWKR